LRTERGWILRTKGGAPVRISHRLRPSRSRRAGILVDRRPARVGGGVGGGGGGSSGGAYVPTGEKARENEGEKSIHLMLGTLRSFAIGDGGEIRSVCRRSRYHARCENGSNLFVGFCPYMNNVLRVHPYASKFETWI